MLENMLLAARFKPETFGKYSAWRGHLPFANWLINETQPSNLVELGSHWGHSYFAFCKSIIEAHHSCKCYAVDTWSGDEHAGFYGEEIFRHVNTINQAHYSNFSTLLRMTFDDALKEIADNTVDLLHIDGLHTYEAVKHDFETWLPKLKNGGIILFHDTEVYDKGFGVWKLWQELTGKYPNSLNFKHSHGLGVLQISDEKYPSDHWLYPGSQDQQLLINYFAALGAREEAEHEVDEQKRKADKIKSQVESMQKSASWKLTKPLRDISNLFKR